MAGNNLTQSADKSASAQGASASASVGHNQIEDTQKISDLSVPTGRISESSQLQVEKASADTEAKKNLHVREVREEQAIRGQELDAHAASAMRTRAPVGTASVDARRNQAVEENTITAGMVSKKRKGGLSSSRETLFQQLVTLLGENTAQEVVKLLERATKEMGSSGNLTPDQAAQVLKDLSRALGKEIQKELFIRTQGNKGEKVEIDAEKFLKAVEEHLLLNNDATKIIGALVTVDSQIDANKKALVDAEGALAGARHHLKAVLGIGNDSGKIFPSEVELLAAVQKRFPGLQAKDLNHAAQIISEAFEASENEIAEKLSRLGTFLPPDAKPSEISAVRDSLFSINSALTGYVAAQQLSEQITYKITHVLADERKQLVAAAAKLLKEPEAGIEKRGAELSARLAILEREIAAGAPSEIASKLIMTRDALEFEVLEERVRKLATSEKVNYSALKEVVEGYLHGSAGQKAPRSTHFVEKAKALGSIIQNAERIEDQVAGIRKLATAEFEAADSALEGLKEEKKEKESQTTKWLGLATDSDGVYARNKFLREEYRPAESRRELASKIKSEWLPQIEKNISGSKILRASLREVGVTADGPTIDFAQLEKIVSQEPTQRILTTEENSREKLTYSENLSAMLKKLREEKAVVKDAGAQPELIGTALGELLPPLKTSNALTPAENQALKTITEQLGGDKAHEMLPKLRMVVDKESAIGRVLNELPTTLPPYAQLARLRANLPESERLKVDTFLALQLPDSTPTTKISDAWRAISSQDGQLLHNRIEATQLLGKLSTIDTAIESLSDSEKERVLAEFERVYGEQIGTHLLKMRDRTLDDGTVLLRVAAMKFISHDNLNRYVTEGDTLPSSVEARVGYLAEELRKDAARKIDLADVERRLTPLSQEHGALTLARRVYSQSSVHSSVLPEIEQAEHRNRSSKAAHYDTITQSYGSAYMYRTNLQVRLEKAVEVVAFNEASTLDADAQVRVQKYHQLLSEKESPTAILSALRDNVMGPSRALVDRAYYAAMTGTPLEQRVVELAGDKKYIVDRAQVLLSGDKDKVVAHDPVFLREAIARGDTRTVIDTLRVLDSAEPGKGVLSALEKNSPQVKEALEALARTNTNTDLGKYIEALRSDDRVTKAVIELRNSSLLSSKDPYDILSHLAKLRRELGTKEMATLAARWKELYQEDIASSISVYLPKEVGSPENRLFAVRGLLSPDDKDLVGACANIVEISFLDKSHPRNPDLIGIIDQLGVPRHEIAALLNKTKNPHDFAQYIGSMGEIGAAKGAVYTRWLQGQSAEQTILAVKDLLYAQHTLSELQSFTSERAEIAQQADAYGREFLKRTNERDRKTSERTFLSRGLAEEIVKNDRRFYQKQEQLVGDQSRALNKLNGTIAAMKATIRQYGDDIKVNGVPSVDLRTTTSTMSQNAMAIASKVEWVVSREADYNKWHKQDLIATKALENRDWWIGFGTSTVKVLVVTGALFAGGPLAAIGVAALFNLADEAYEVRYRGKSISDATVSFLFRTGVDAALILCFNNPVVSKVLGKIAPKLYKVEVISGELGKQGGWRLGERSMQRLADKLMENVAKADSGMVERIREFSLKIFFDPSLSPTEYQLNKKDNLDKPDFTVKPKIEATTGDGLGTTKKLNPIETKVVVIEPPFKRDDPLATPPQPALQPLAQQPLGQQIPIVAANEPVPLPQQQQNPIANDIQPIVEATKGIGDAVQSAIDDALRRFSEWLNTPPAPPEPPPFIPPVLPPGQNLAGDPGSTPKDGDGGPKDGGDPPGPTIAMDPKGSGAGVQQNSDTANSPNALPQLAQTSPSAEEAQQILARADAEFTAEPSFPSPARNRESNQVDALALAALQPQVHDIEQARPVPKKLEDDRFISVQHSLDLFNEQALAAQNKHKQDLLLTQANWNTQQNSNQNSNAVGIGNSLSNSLSSLLVNEETNSTAVMAAHVNSSAHVSFDTNEIGQTHTAAYQQASVAISSAEGANAQNSQTLTPQVYVDTLRNENRMAFAAEAVRAYHDTTSSSAHSEKLSAPSIASFLSSGKKEANGVSDRFTEVASRALNAQPKDHRELLSKAESKHSNSNAIQSALRGTESSEKRDARSSAEKAVVAHERVALTERANEGGSKFNSSQMMPHLTDESGIEESGTKFGGRDSDKRGVIVPEDLREVYEQIQIHKEMLANLQQTDQEMSSHISDDSRESERQHAKKMRAKKRAQADSRLREFIINQLRTRQFQAAERDKLMALLVKLGISEIEYRKLVVQLGELEAQRVAAGAAGYQNKSAIEQEITEKDDSDIPTEEATQHNAEKVSSFGKNDTEIEKSVDVSVVEHTISRADLFDRLRRE